MTAPGATPLSPGEPSRGDVDQAAPVRWPSLTVEAATVQWNLLADWVEDTLIGWYQLTREQLPDCWAPHRQVVLELSWLRTAYLQAYQPQAAARHAAEWHTRWRHNALANLAAAVPTTWCRPGEHLVHERTSEERQVAASRAKLEAEQMRQLDERFKTARSRRSQPPPSPVRKPSYHHVVPPGEERATRDRWEHHLRAAIEQDLAARGHEEVD